jgi:hypothetical protein
MINIKKGPAHSLGQADIRGTASTGIYAGMLCYIDTSGIVQKAGGTTYSQLGLRGFAINNSNDGDVIESNKIALYTLDGASVIETDQVDTATDGAITAANYPVGTPLYASQQTNKAGLVGKTSTGTPGPVIGYVEGIRFLQNCTPYPSGVSSSQNYTSATEQAAYDAANAAGSTNIPIYTATTKSATFKAQVNVPVLAIKLASSN